MYKTIMNFLPYSEMGNKIHPYRDWNKIKLTISLLCKSLLSSLFSSQMQSCVDTGWYKPSLFIPSEGYPMFPHFQLDISILSHVREFDLALFQRIVGRVA